MKAIDYLRFTALSAAAIKTNTTDGCVVWHFVTESDANILSVCLEAMGILGASGQRKHVGQHIEGNDQYGVVLTPENIETINRKLHEMKPVHTTLDVTTLSKNITDNFQWSYGGYYRNAQPAITNLLKALREYSVSGNLLATIVPSESQGQGSSQQPAQIGLTFLYAIDPTQHGNIIQTITAIRDAKSPIFVNDVALANALEAAVDAIKQHFGDAPAGPVARPVSSIQFK